MNYVIWDVETDSADTNYATIIEIGALLLDENFKEKERFSARCRLPQDRVPSATALCVNRSSIDLLTKQNLRLNNIASREILLSKSNTMKNFNKKKYYDLIFANILFDPLTSLAPRLKFISKPNSFIVLSGLLSNQITNIVNRYKMFGFKLKKKIIINGWGTVIMRRQF